MDHSRNNLAKCKKTEKLFSSSLMLVFSSLPSSQICSPTLSGENMGQIIRQRCVVGCWWLPEAVLSTGGGMQGDVLVRWGSGRLVGGRSSHRLAVIHDAAVRSETTSSLLLLCSCGAGLWESDQKLSLSSGLWLQRCNRHDMVPVMSFTPKAQQDI